MSEDEKKTLKSLLEFYKTHIWVQQENGRWILIYNPKIKTTKEEG